MKKTSYTIEVNINGDILYYALSSRGVAYRPLEAASTTSSFATLGEWKAYVESDLNNNSLDSYKLVEVELKAKESPGIENDIKDAIERNALSKLTAAERQVLGI